MTSLIPPLPASGRPLPLKVVIRLLPPTVTEEDLQIPEDTKRDIEWSRFVAGRRPERPSPENPIVNARFYAQFKSFPSAADFISKFHGRLFSVAKGEVFRAVAAFAPYQRVPRPAKQLRNTIDNTYEESEHFKTFIETGPSIVVSEAVSLTDERRQDYISPLVRAIADSSNKLNAAVDSARAARPASKKAPKAVEPVPATKAKSAPKQKAQKAKNPPVVPVEPVKASKKAPPPPPAQAKPMIMKRTVSQEQAAPVGVPAPPPPPAHPKAKPPKPKKQTPHPMKVDSW